MFNRSHRSHSKTQGFLAELGLGSSDSSTVRSGTSSTWRTDRDRPSYNYASSTASARSYGAPFYPEKSRSRALLASLF